MRAGKRLFLKPGASRSTVAHNGRRMPPDREDSKRYLYEQIYGELKKEILSGTYKKGDWFPPERVLKDRFNTTHLTVRNALAKLVLDGYIERYSGKGTIVIYARERSPVPRKLLSFPWAHLVCDELDEANALLLESLETQLRKVPLPVRFSCHHGDVLLARSLYRESRESGALLVLQPAGSMEPQDGAEAPPAGTILIRSFASEASCPQVVLDDAEGARRAVGYLRDLGYGVIALLASGAAQAQAALQQGFAEGISGRGMRPEAGVVETCVPGLDGGSQAARSVLGRMPGCRAFLCSSDETATGAVGALRGAGLNAGVDSAVVGWGNTRLARGMELTSVDPGYDRLSERVLACIMEGMSRGSFTPEVFRIVPELRIRSSCASAQSARGA